MSACGLRPFRGQVLVALLPAQAQTAAGVHLPDKRRPDVIGRKPARRAKVIGLGIWPTSRKGRMLAYEFKPGDIVLVDEVLGRNFDAYPAKWKLYDYREILAKEAPEA